MKEETGIAVPTETRRLAAIMFTDMVGFSRQMGSDETRMLRLLDVHNEVIQQAVVEHHGLVIKTVGDAFLVDFPSVVHAVQCAQQIQMQLRSRNAEKESEEQIHVRIGIHSGDIVQRDGDVFGDGVNLASRLQALAEPDSICISDVVYRDVVKKVDLGTVVSLGRPQLKNIAERFQVYALLPETSKGIRRVLQVQWLKASRRVRPAHRAAVAGLLLIAATVIAVRYLPILLPSSQPSAPSTLAALPFPDKPSIVVLPFVNRSEDPKQEYFSDGMGFPQHETIGFGMKLGQFSAFGFRQLVIGVFIQQLLQPHHIRLRSMAPRRAPQRFVIQTVKSGKSSLKRNRCGFPTRWTSYLHGRSNTAVSDCCVA